MENVDNLKENQILTTFNASTLLKLSESDFAKKFHQNHVDLNQLWDCQKNIEKTLIEQLESLWKSESEQKQLNTELKEQLRQLKEEKQTLMAEMQSDEVKASALNEELAEARKTQLMIAEKFGFENERDSSVLDMLRNVTQIHFHDNQTLGLLKGVVTDLSDIQPFSYDTNEISVQDIAEKLWGQMNKDKEFLYDPA